MNLFITGAAGFLGQHVVATALRRGHRVRALVRPATRIGDLPFAEHPRCTLVRLDLRCRPGLAEALADTDAVLHLAAVKSGDLHTQLFGNIVTTENLLAAMARRSVTRLVAVSSFAVYDYLHRWPFARLDEDSPLERAPDTRDEYCQTKLLQEKLIRAAAVQNNLRVTILRPGVIFGKDNLFTSRLGMPLGRRTWLRLGAWAPLPLTYVENCAQAVLLAVENDAAINQTFNVVDDHSPTQRRYARLLQRRLDPPPRIIPIPWSLIALLARAAWLINRLVFAGRAKAPGILVPARLHARTKPLRYSNRRLKQTLAWQPRYNLVQGLDRSISRSSRHADPARNNPAAAADLSASADNVPSSIGPQCSGPQRHDATHNGIRRSSRAPSDAPTPTPEPTPEPAP